MAAVKEQVDHVHAAEGRLDRAGELARASSGQDGYIGIALAEAQVHASLAIAEQLERLNETLEKGAIEVMYGGATV